ncbi:hypothetical protein EJ05DRAFT_480582 [Pseudovirgaria hyperparasitica]|uniref:Uncharacterized protein n=1 Tax=Pseudovirgaria hyperparasitica TaxID=470096 RepID=A0A6A6VU12_9PEZI|nr:uncharacterized protein EJ05DRAFT_480582 [Pseudovirgaria hyperparasitica]KAF2753224.1 hypothetical protein EJ05DRAFT_480582 [Pseudovirgaria hyperparasitica]
MPYSTGHNNTYAPSRIPVSSSIPLPPASNGFRSTSHDNNGPLTLNDYYTNDGRPKVLPTPFYHNPDLSLSSMDLRTSATGLSTLPKKKKSRSTINSVRGGDDTHGTPTIMPANAKTNRPRTSSRSQTQPSDNPPKFKSRWRGQPLALQAGPTSHDNRAAVRAGGSRSPAIRSARSMTSIGNKTPTAMSSLALPASKSPIRESYATWRSSATRSQQSTPAEPSPITPAQMYSFLYERIVTPTVPSTPMSLHSRCWDGEPSDHLASPDEEKLGPQPYFDSLLLPDSNMADIAHPIAEEPESETDLSLGSMYSGGLETAPPSPTESVQPGHEVESGAMDQFIADFSNVEIQTSRHRSNSCPAPTVQNVRTTLSRRKSLFKGVSLDSGRIMRQPDAESILAPTVYASPADEDSEDDAAPPAIRMRDTPPPYTTQFNADAHDATAAYSLLSVRRSSLSSSRRCAESLTLASKRSEESLAPSEDRTIVAESPIMDYGLGSLTKADFGDDQFRERPITIIHIPTGDPAFLAGEANELQLPDTPVSAIFDGGSDVHLEPPPPVPARSPLRETFSLTPTSAEFTNGANLLSGPWPELSPEEASFRADSPPPTLVTETAPETFGSEEEGEDDCQTPTFALPSAPEIFVSEIHTEVETQADYEVPTLVVSSSPGAVLEETMTVSQVYKMPSYIKSRSISVESQQQSSNTSRSTSPTLNFSRPRPISPISEGCVMSTIAVVADIKPTSECAPEAEAKTSIKPTSERTPQAAVKASLKPQRAFQAAAKTSRKHASRPALQSLAYSETEAQAQPVTSKSLLPPHQRRGSMESMASVTPSVTPSILSLRWMQSPKERLGLGGLLKKNEEVPWETELGKRERGWKKSRASQLFTRTQFFNGERK